MAFDGKALNHLYDWWYKNGNPKISIWLDYDGELVFFDDDQDKRVARIAQPDDYPCFLDYSLRDDPFTDQEHRELAKFVRKNNAKFYD